jgi:hypothetical protein
MKDISRHTQASIRPGDPGIDEAWMRRCRQGALAPLVWLFGWMPVLGVGVWTKAGIFGWQLRAIGSDNPVLTALPMFLVIWVGPVFVVNLMKKDVSRPFLFGIQNSLAPMRPPVLILRSRDPEREARIARIMVRVFLTAAALCIVPIAVGIWKISQAESAPHVPLPALDYDKAVSGATLPERARIEGVSAFTRLAWVHNYSIRQTRYRYVYYPLVPTGWEPDQPVRLIELDPTHNEVNAPGAREGELYPLDDDWLAGEISRAGLKLADHVVILKREQLNGYEPRLDVTVPFFYCIFPAILALVMLALAGAMRWRWRLGRPAKHNTSG